MQTLMEVYCKSCCCIPAFKKQFSEQILVAFLSIVIERPI